MLRRKFAAHNTCIIKEEISGGGEETPVGCEVPTGGGGKKRDSLGTVGSAHLIIKDLGEIHSRLLDHRPVIQGETRYFVKEFEEKHCKRLMTQSVDSNRENRNEKRCIMTTWCLTRSGAASSGKSL
uniref:Biogenesis of lysosome-related organelles complex 1 subunit 5 n=1 Tax=Oryctolagus cuniculus TaxID=9986 RepID=A0A5F9CI10_RABIT